MPKPPDPDHTVISFTVPGPATPEQKRQVRMGRNAARVDTPKARDYKALVSLAAAQAMGEDPPLEGALRVDIIAHHLRPKSWPKWRQEPTSRPDRTNYAKLAEDACNGIVYVDDSQIVAGEVGKRISDREYLEIRVEWLGW